MANAGGGGPVRHGRRAVAAVLFGAVSLMIVGAFGGVGGAVISATASSAQYQYTNKVAVCHRTGLKRNPFVTMFVNKSEVDDHLAHGDTVGACKTARLNLSGSFRNTPSSPQNVIDPALAYTATTWQLEYATCAKLMNYPDQAAPAGVVPVPEVASGMPQISADGKTYTFTLRRDFKFSPPSSERVTAETFRRMFERTLHPAMNSPARNFMTDVVGASAYSAGTASSISGITAKGTKLTIQLTKPAGDLLARLALPFFCAVPTGSPIDPSGMTVLPSAGPYNIVSFDPEGLTVLRRNPEYRGKRPRFFEEIVYHANVPQSTSEAQVIDGSRDYVVDGLPRERWAVLAPQYGPGSPAASAGRQQMFVSRMLGVDYLALNTSRPLFANTTLRKAVNYALDRPALTAARGAFGGEPSDQILMEGMPGFQDVDVYPLTGPDLATAQALAAASGQVPATAVLYTANMGPRAARAQTIKDNLAAIGIDVEIHQFPPAELFTRGGTQGEPFDILDAGWIADYPDPFAVIDMLLNGNRIEPTGNNNLAYFDDPAFNQRMDDAAALQPPPRYDAYADLDEDITRDAAPWAVYGNINSRDFFSARIGCHVFSPAFGMDIAALCLR